MCTGTPQQVTDDVKELIDTFADNGGLIIDSTLGIPDEAKYENVQAMTEATRLSLTSMLTSINNIVLDFGRKHDKIGTKASHPDYQVPVLLGMYFGIP